MSHVGKLFIDGLDAFLEYGITVARYGYKQVVQMPAYKKMNSTDWQDEDGEEIDLSEPKLEARSIQIEFNITNIRFAEDLFYELSNKSYHVFDFIELKKSYKLRLIQNGRFDSLIKLGKLTLTFSDDFPKFPTGNYYGFGKTEIRVFGYEVDGLDFSQFGAWVLRDTDTSIRKAADIKENLKVTNQTMNGVLYNGTHAYFKPKDTTIKLLINANSIDEFWSRYNALFAVILQPESRRLYYCALQIEYSCYYKNSNVIKFDILPNGKIWCEFSITLTITDYRPVSQYMLLAHEDFALVEVEVGGVATFIKIRPKRGITILSHQAGQYVTANSGGKEILIYLNK